MPQSEQDRLRAFVAVELASVLVIVVSLVVFVALATHDGRRRARTAGSITNLQQFAAGASSFAADNADRWFSFTWRQGEFHQGSGPLRLSAGGDRPSGRG